MMKYLFMHVAVSAKVYDKHSEVKLRYEKASSIISDMLCYKRYIAKIGNKVCKLRECSGRFLQPQVEVIALDSTGIESSTRPNSGDGDASNAIEVGLVEDVATTSMPCKTVDVLFKENVHV